MYRKRTGAGYLNLLPVLILLFFMGPGCSNNPIPGKEGSEQTPAGLAKQRVSLTVSAAADLNYAFNEIGKVFGEKTGTMVTFNFGSTGQLAQQIERGAPVDVFAAADVSFVEELERQGLILPGTKSTYGRGFLVIWTRNDSALRFDKIEDLVNARVRRIAIANPDHAPYGMAAREALQSAGILEQVQPKLVLGENVRQTLQYAETGNVDAAIVALSLAMSVEGGLYTPVLQDMYKPLDQALAVIAGTKYEAESRAFAAFVNGPEGRAIMRRYGFLLPGEQVAP